MSKSEDIADEVTRRQIELERYKKGFQIRMQKVIDGVLASIIARVAALPEGPSKERLRKVAVEIMAMSKKLEVRISKAMLKELKKLAGIEASYIQSVLDTYIPPEVQVSIGLPSAESIRRAVEIEPFQGRVLEKWAKSVGTVTADRARVQINIGMAEGESIHRITRRVREVTRQTRRDTDVIVRTAVNHVSNAVKRDVYKANDDIIKGVQWRSTLDGRTSAICRSRDGKTYPIDKHPTPPAHPNCRSVIVPVLKSFKELGVDLGEIDDGTRASMNGQVPANLNYNDWLKKQPKEFIESVLGKARTKLFLDGRATMDKFVDYKGKLIPLEELRTKL